MTEVRIYGLGYSSPANICSVHHGYLRSLVPHRQQPLQS